MELEQTAIRRQPSAAFMSIGNVLIWENHNEKQNIEEAAAHRSHLQSRAALFRLIGVVFLQRAINVSVFMADFNGEFGSVHSFAHCKNQIASNHAFDL